MIYDYVWHGNCFNKLLFEKIKVPKAILEENALVKINLRLLELLTIIKIRLQNEAY